VVGSLAVDGRADVELSTAVEKTVEEAHSALKYV